MDGPKGENWTATKVDSPSRVDGSSGSGRSWGKVNGLSETLTLMRNYPNPNVKLLQPEFVSNPYPNFELP